jgi:hypothetical protein
MNVRRVNLDGHSIVMEFHIERRRAHLLHVDDSAETKPWDHPDLFRTWIEEVMEAVQEHGRVAHHGPFGRAADLLRQGHSFEEIETQPLVLLALRKELVQVGAMTAMWIAAIDAHLGTKGDLLAPADMNVHTPVDLFVDNRHESS